MEGAAKHPTHTTTYALTDTVVGAYRVYEAQRKKPRALRRRAHRNLDKEVEIIENWRWQVSFASVYTRSAFGPAGEVNTILPLRTLA